MTNIGVSCEGWASTVVLENFRIQGFRCFSDFRIEGLRRINLIAGKNGVGKSALLEAIRLY